MHVEDVVCQLVDDQSLLRVQTVKLVHIIQPDNVKQSDDLECKLLDCCTVTQAKEKAMDTLYANIPFTKRPSLDQVELRAFVFADDCLLLTE